MKLQALAFTALTLLPLTGCLDQDGLDPSDLDDADLGVVESAICLWNTVAPLTADTTWDLNNGSPKSFQFNTYGSASCRRVIVGYENASDASAKVHYTGIQPIFTASNCGDVTVRGRFWYFDNGAWTFIGTRTDTGTWTGFGCVLPEVSYVGSIIRDEIRVEITTEWNTSDQLPVRTTGVK
jgi:hypothetical protein